MKAQCKRSQITSVLILSLLLFLLSCAAPEKTTYTPKHYSQNEEVLFDGIQYNITEIFWAQQIGPQYLKKQANASWLVIGLSITNRTQRPVDKTFNPIFKLEDTTGAEYESSKYVLLKDGIEFKMSTEALNPNVTFKGYLVFDVPRQNDYKLRILSPFYARQAFAGSIKLLGLYFYFQLAPSRAVQEWITS